MDELAKLVDGVHRFQTKYFGQDNNLFEQLKRGQSPTSLVIGCSDSRVDPALLTDCNPGDMFVVRNVANLVPPYEKDGTYHGVSSAIEFAVCDLQIKRIIVLGHSSCGGIGALLKGYNPKTEANFVGRWMRMAESARQYVLDNYADKTLPEQIRACEMAAIVVSLDNLMSFPFIADAIAQGKLFLVGWYFDIERGELHQYDAATGEFRSLVPPLVE